MRRAALAACAAFLLVSVGTRAETLLDQTGTVVAPSAPSAVLRTFDVSAAGAYQLTVTDFGVPGALGDVRAAVLRDGAIVRQLELGTAANASASFDATAGSYALSIVGTPGATGVGTVGARIARGADTPVLDITATISAAAPPPPATRRTLDATFAVTDAGDYRVSLADLGFPVPLAAARLSIVREGGSSVAAQLAAPGSAMFAATPGSYRLFVIADADAAATAGVFYAAVQSVATDAVIYRRMLPVGRVEELGAALLPAGPHVLIGSDLAIPSPLNSIQFAVTSGGQLVTRLDAPGSVDFTALAAGHEFLAAAKPAAASSGSFTLDLQRGGSSALDFVGTSSDGASSGATPLTGSVVAAGRYRLRLTDFTFPQGLTQLRATLTQPGVSGAVLNGPGVAEVDLVTGPVRVLVFGQAGSSGNGIYGVELAPVSGSASTVIEATRGVGSAFAAWQFSVTTAGRYQVFADDLEFPARFAGFDAVITRGPEVVGSFFGGGSFIFSATPGNYFINFIARPSANSGGAGTYRMRVASAAALPTVTLTASPSTVTAGTATQLTWTSTNATQCTATGAWAGNKAASGNETTVAISSQSTFNLECTGPGGVSNAQLVVNVAQPGGAGDGRGSGGGALSETLLAALLAILLLQLLTSAPVPPRLRR